MYKFVGGLSSKGVLDEYKRGEFSVGDLILPNLSLTLWCICNIGVKFYFKNLDWFTLLTLYGWRTILLELIRK